MQLVPPLIQIIGLIIGAVLTALLAVRGYRQQREIDRQQDLVKLRRGAYEKFVHSYAAYTSAEEGSPAEDEAWNEYLDAYRSLFHVASDRFLRAAMDFYEVRWADFPSEEAYREKWKELYTKLLFEMRKDAFEETKLSIETIEGRLPWSWS